ncbi:MAG: hypothetical protein GXO69_10825 [Acidobacteria bacterium]|nr:hypothetical protein [Acidobacteriota bacterium]
MSDQIPPVPQVPQTPQPDPAAPGSPKKKGLPALAWVGIGCGTIVLLVIIGLVALGGYAVHKVKQAGFDPGLWKRNPTAAAAKIITTMNPDVEIVSTDNNSQTITIRNRKTGKTVTVDLQDVKNGKFRFFDEKGHESTVTLSGSAPGENGKRSGGSMSIKTSEGKVNISTGTKADKLPEWVPLYRDVVPTKVMVMTADRGTSGSYSIVVKDSVDDTVQFMESKLKDSGFTISKNSYSVNNEKWVNLSAQKNGKLSVNIIVTRTNEGTGINVTFSEKFGS